MRPFEDIIEEYHPILYKIGRVYSAPDEFDDLYQEMLIGVWKGLKSFRGDSKISTWIYRVALNTALSYKKKQRKNVLSLGESIPLIRDKSESADKRMEKNEEVQRLYAAIRELKESERSIILLYLEERSYEEIAEIIGITISNVGVRINRIKKKLFKLLNP